MRRVVVCRLIVLACSLLRQCYNVFLLRATPRETSRVPLSSDQVLALTYSMVWGLTLSQGPTACGKWGPQPKPFRQHGHRHRGSVVVMRLMKAASQLENLLWLGLVWHGVV